MKTLSSKPNKAQLINNSLIETVIKSLREEKLYWKINQALAPNDIGNTTFLKFFYSKRLFCRLRTLFCEND